MYINYHWINRNQHRYRPIEEYYDIEGLKEYFQKLQAMGVKYIWHPPYIDPYQPIHRIPDECEAYLIKKMYPVLLCILDLHLDMIKLYLNNHFDYQL